MPTAFTDTPVRTLACMEPGERLQVQHIVFEAVRAHCARAGLHEGQTTTCLATSDLHVLLELPGGRAVVLERAWARFVEVAGM